MVVPETFAAVETVAETTPNAGTPTTGVGVRVFVGVLVGVYVLVVSGVAIFFWPMYNVHMLMLDERVELQKTLDGIARRIHKLDDSILRDPSAMPTEERKKNMDEIEWVAARRLAAAELRTRAANGPEGWSVCAADSMVMP